MTENIASDVVIDDLLNCPTRPWGIGPCRAWVKAIIEGIVVQKELYEDGKPGRKDWPVFCR